MKNLTLTLLLWAHNRIFQFIRVCGMHGREKKDLMTEKSLKLLTSSYSFLVSQQILISIEDVSSFHTQQRKRMKLFSRYYFVSDLRIFLLVVSCRRSQTWIAYRCVVVSFCKNCFSHEKSAKRQREICHQHCVWCVHVHDVILNKQQSSQSIIKHTLCRAFPQCSFLSFFIRCILPLTQRHGN